MSMQLEKKLVEDYVIERLKKIGWNYLKEEDLKRNSLDEPLLTIFLKNKIREINDNLDEEDIENVLKKLQMLTNDQNGHKKILEYFKKGVEIKTVKDKSVKYVNLFDYKDLKNNEFIFTNQFKFNGKENIRLDLVLFINGIPIVNIECKNPYTNKTDYNDAFLQIKRYEKVGPELYKYIQIGIGFAEKVKYFPIVPWLEPESINQEIWRDENGNEIEGIFNMLAPAVLLDILKNFIFVKEFKGEMKKVIGRYMQYKAVNKIYQRVIDNLNGLTEKNKGLIWHWQGSGKTLTMIFAAHKLYFDERLATPTIFFIVDRRDLERQFNDELSSIDLNFVFKKIETINHLKEVISANNYSGESGVFLTLIHKFNESEYEILDKLLDHEGAIFNRKNIICFLDEVHRTQYGILAEKMRNILRNAFFFGFTGTPIVEQDKNTYRKFGYPVDGELYLDKYFIDEALRDGFIVPIVYQQRKEELQVQETDLNWFVEQAFDDIEDEYVKSKVSSEVKKKLDKTILFLENEKRIGEICCDIAQHFKENFDGRFKGLIVTGSRLACVRYKKAIDKYLNPSYSEVVMTFNQYDKEEIQEYKNKLIERFGNRDVGKVVEEIIEKFRKEEEPKLLIVTDMLITGFDEPKLGIIYLDKLLKNHKLLQTIARVNRPYKNIPKIGVVIDYVGILKNIDKAFKLYEDIDKIKTNGVVNQKEFINKFLKVLDELKKIFGDIINTLSRENFDKGLKIIIDEDNEKKFVELYRELRKYFEYMGENRLKYLKEYKWFTSLYEYWNKLKRPDINEKEIVEKYLRRTVDIINDLIEIKEIKEISKPMVIDLDYIEAIKNSDLTEEEKAIGIINTLDRLVIIYGERNPIYRSIADKVKRLIEEWKNRAIDYHHLSEEGIKIYEWILEKEKEKRELELDDFEYGIKILLESRIKLSEEEVQKLAKEIYNDIKENLFKGWSKNFNISRKVEVAIREKLSNYYPKFFESYDKFVETCEEIFDFLIKNDI